MGKKVQKMDKMGPEKGKIELFCALPKKGESFSFYMLIDISHNIKQVEIGIVLWYLDMFGHM